jgi:hypothetical protein
MRMIPLLGGFLWAAALIFCFGVSLSQGHAGIFIAGVIILLAIKAAQTKNRP